MIDAQTIRKRIEARKLVEDFDSKAVSADDPKQAEIIYTAMYSSIPNSYLPQPEVRVISDAEAKKAAKFPACFRQICWRGSKRRPSQFY
jgi:hypothetical protein